VLTKKFSEENKELIAQYKELSKKHRDNEKEFKELFVNVQKRKPEITKEEFRKFLGEETKESKEKQILALKEDIINKPNATPRHKEWLKDKVDKLMKLEDLE